MPKDKYVIQCDFDGTLTTEDISFHILEKFTDSGWRKDFEDYQSGLINVGQFNKKAFARVCASESELTDFVKSISYERSGIAELLAFCKSNDIEFNIVSNGLRFYINIILQKLGIENVSVYAAETDFSSGCLKTAYYSIDNEEVMDGYKEGYAKHFLTNGRKLIYIGNGPSDVPAASFAHKVFATGYMIDGCKEQGIDCHGFEMIDEIIAELKKLV